MIRKYHNHTLQTNSWHCDEELQDTRKTSKVKQPDPFPIKMIAILERRHNNVQQNVEQTQNPTMGATINNESTSTEPSP